jgi:hypothetical protein
MEYKRQMCDFCDCVPNVENKVNGDLRKIDEVKKQLLNTTNMKTNDVSCVICMDSITEDINKTTLRCGHVFHTSCFCENVIQSNNKCPLCRITICSEVPKMPNLTKQITGKIIQQIFLGDKSNLEMYTFLKSISDILGIELNEVHSEDKLMIYRKIVRLLMSFGFNLGALIRQWIEEGNGRYNEELDDFNIIVQINEIIQQEQEYSE